MVDRDIRENREKEAIRRNLLATMLRSANTGQLANRGRFTDSPGRLTRVWQGLFRKSPMQ